MVIRPLMDSTAFILLKNCHLVRAVSIIITVLCMALLIACSDKSEEKGHLIELELNKYGTIHSKWTGWIRPVDQPVFNTDFGNNHDSILFVEPELEYPYHLIVSHSPEFAFLWRTKSFSWNSSDWELVSDNYVIGPHYEFDDGIKVDDIYYVFEEGLVYSFTGPLEESSGKWEVAGTFPHEDCDDVGVFFEDGVFHLFGEYGNYPHGPDGTSLSHYISHTGLGDWTLIETKAVDPNPDGGDEYGVGDPTIAKIEGSYYIFSDLESKGSPYKVVSWQSDDLNHPFKYLGTAIQARTEETDDWDNYRIQDPDIGFIPELNRYVMFCNMMDKDGDPGGSFLDVKGGGTRVIGVFYSTELVFD